MKYKDPVTGEFKDVIIKVTDTLPVGSIVDYEGENIPEGWEKIEYGIIVDGPPVAADYKIDGKDVYIKRLNVLSLMNTQSLVVSTGLNDITCEYLEGLYKVFVGSQHEKSIPINFIELTDTNDITFVATHFDPSDNSIKIKNTLVDTASGKTKNIGGYVDIYFTYNEEV